MSEQSKKLPRATIDQAKAAWDAHPDPSIRGVVDAMQATGLICAIATLQRWHTAKWKLKKKTHHVAVAEQAKAAVSEGVKRQDDAVLVRIAAMAAEEAALRARVEELGKIEQDSELARLTIRASMIAQIVLAEQVTRRAADLVERAPGKVGIIIEALKGPASSTTILMPSAQTPQTGGDGARVVEGRVIEESATQLAITAFRSRQKHGVAA